MHFKLGRLGGLLSRAGGLLNRLYWRLRLHSFGEGSRIYGMARIYVPRAVAIGRNVSINDFVHIWGAGGVTIGDDTLVAAHTVITSQTHDAEALGRGVLYRQTHFVRKVVIGKNVWIGSAAVILPGITVGDDSIVAAGAVVTKDVPPKTLVGGIPAQVLKHLGAKSE